MSALTFLQVLRFEVARMQSLHPEREGELARACALITNGMVSAAPDDPQTGRVLSHDLGTLYHVNGSCSCQAGQHGKDCKHQHAWKLYQYVERKVAEQPEPVETTTPSATPPALPEAPVSITLKGTWHGQDVMVTLRGIDFASVKAQVEEAAQWLERPQAKAAPQPQEKGEDWCSKHSATMQWNTGKDGKRGWYSHKTSEGWCKGR